MKSAAALAGLSGAAALAFENLWFRSASIALGSGVWSSAIVLAAFMAGLAIGGLAAMWLEDRIARPLRVYAGLELAIGLSGLAALLVLPHLSGALAPAFAAAGSSTLVNLLRFSASFALLIGPAACMGATLPVLMRALVTLPAAFGEKLGWIYAANTVGAVAGVLACELILVPRAGIAGAGSVAAAVSGLAALMAATIRPVDAVRPSPARPRRVARGTSNDVRLVRSAPARALPLLVASFASGGLFLAFEVAAFRLLLLFFPPHGPYFAVMLAVVLGGLALGSMCSAWLIRRRPETTGLLPPAFAVAGAALACTYQVFPTALETALTWPPVVATVAAVLAFTLPLSIASGLIFGALGQALHRSEVADSRATALLSASNTVGAMAGSLVAGLTLIERVGLEQLFWLIGAGYGAVALLLIATTGRSSDARRPPLMVAGAACALGLAFFPTGQMDSTLLRFPIAALVQTGEARIAVKEGQLETVQILRKDSLGRPDYYRLVTNNHSMSASDPRHRRYMRLFAHLPTVLHPAPRRAALLGVGLGVTAQALVEDPRFTTVDVVDLSRDIPAMLPLVFPAPEKSPLGDPRVRLHIEDARFFLATTGEQYDVITGEPPPPHHAGVSNLYSREFFGLLADRLAPGGLATYWLPVHDLRADEARAIVAAFIEVFPETTLWTGSGFDWMLMGLKPPGGGVNDDAFRGWWTRAPLASRLREIGVERPEGLGALFLADGPRLRAWVGGAAPVTDNFPRRISVDRRRDDRDVAEFLSLLTASERPVNFIASPLIASLWPEGLRASTLNGFARQAVVDVILSQPALGVDDLERLLGADPGPLDPIVVKALFWRHGVDFDRAEAMLAAEPGLQGTGLAEYRAELALMNGNPLAAADWLGQSTISQPNRLATIRAYALLRAGDKAGAVRAARGE